MFVAKLMMQVRSRPSGRPLGYGYVLIIRLGIIGASLGKGMQEVKAGIEEPLELILAVLWWANGVGAG